MSFIDNSSLFNNLKDYILYTHSVVTTNRTNVPHPTDPHTILNKYRFLTMHGTAGYVVNVNSTTGSMKKETTTDRYFSIDLIGYN